MYLDFKTFSSLIVEENNHGSELHYYDLDDTLVHHDHDLLRVHVVDPAGKRVQTLTSSEYNTHQLPKDHKYDFREFKSSDVFGKSAKPIKQMIKKLQNLHKAGHKVEILTARQDLDDQKKFAHHMKKFGIDIDKIHVRRAGNLGAGNTAATKKKVILDALSGGKYKSVHLYDDSKENLEAFLTLKKKFKEIQFNAHHIDHNPKTSEVKIKTRML